MPTYEYECSECSHRFEKFQPITSKPLSRCPKCRGKVRRLIGAGAGIIFKGSGFYQTDYRSDSYKKKAEADKPKAASVPPKSDAPSSPPAASSPKPAKSGTSSS